MSTNRPVHTIEQLNQAKGLITEYLEEFNEAKEANCEPRAQQCLAMAMSIAAKFRIPCKVYSCGQSK